MNLPVTQFDAQVAARALARYTLDHQEHLGQTRPLMVLGEHLVRLTGADRQLAGRVREPFSG